jgi:adenine deaminase
MMANAAGRDGIAWFMEDTRDLPLRIYLLTPSMIPPFPALETSREFPLEAFQEMIKEDRVLGVGETYWPLVLDMDERAMAQYAIAQEVGKTREGHAAGARGRRLIAYRAAGTTSCHEATTPEEALERLRLGMAVMVREGSVRRELATIAAVKDMGVDLRNMMLCTDWADAQMMIEHGCMDVLVRRAIAAGFDPVVAIQMVTINSAEYFGLRRLGGVGPGKIADLLLLSDLRQATVETVIKDGEVVAHKGALVKDPPRYRYPKAARHSFALEGVEEADFAIAYEGKGERALVRVVDCINETITQELQAEVKVEAGNLVPSPEQDIIKMAVICKYEERPHHARGFVHGLGMREGALATSLIWDTCNILVVGASEREMVSAVNRLLEHQGGIVVVRGEKVVAELPLPICGTTSDKPLEEIAQRIAEIEKGCRGLGFIPRPFLTLQTLPFTGLPYLRLTDRGLVDIRKRGFVDLIIS